MGGLGGRPEGVSTYRNAVTRPRRGAAGDGDRPAVDHFNGVERRDHRWAAAAQRTYDRSGPVASDGTCRRRVRPSAVEHLGHLVQACGRQASLVCSLDRRRGGHLPARRLGENARPQLVVLPPVLRIVSVDGVRRQQVAQGRPPAEATPCTPPACPAHARTRRHCQTPRRPGPARRWRPVAGGAGPPAGLAGSGGRPARPARSR